MHMRISAHASKSACIVGLHLSFTGGNQFIYDAMEPDFSTLEIYLRYRLLQIYCLAGRPLRIMPAEQNLITIGRIRYFFWYVSCMFGMWIKKWSRIRGIARHKICMVLPFSLLFEQNLPPFRALSANAY